jgi:hypothetical protein
MLAATDRREIRAHDGDLSRPAAQMPSSVFRAAYKELCTRIWIELELLAQGARQVNSSPPQDLMTNTEILRLELVVLVDCCRSPYWRCLLSLEQCDSLCSMLTDVLAALYVDSEHLSTGIAEAQGRVLDELLPESGDEPGEDFPPALKELVSLIEAQAAARAVR